MTNPLNSAAAYGRVSTDKQEQSSAAQIERLRHYAGQEQLALAEHALFLEEDVSGSVPFAERPRAGVLLQQFKAGRFQHLIVPTIDRLGRGALDVQNTIALIHQLGGTVHILDLGGSSFNTRSPVSGLIIAVLAWAAQMELTRIQERVAGGLQHKRVNGELCGSVPYGWDAVPTGETRINKGGKPVAIKRMVDQPEEQRWILHMHRLRAAGWGYHRIAAELNRLGVPTKRGKGEIMKVRVAGQANGRAKVAERFTTGRWQAGNVARVLQNQTVRAWLATNPAQQLAA